MKKRPICVHCHQPYGQRGTETHTVKWPAGEPMPEYTGNGILIKTSTPYQTTSRATVRTLTMVTSQNRQMVEADLAKLPEKAGQVAYRTTWDGETWVGGYRPFCTLRCALDYARKKYYQGD